MNVCMTVSGELPAWVWLLLTMAAVLMVGIWLTAAAERISERRSRMHKVRCGCAVRIKQRDEIVARGGRSLSAPMTMGSVGEVRL